jgi:TIR domain
MPGIFISYRRIDTVASAGRLFADLSKRFNVSQVFMDINGGIPRGAQFEDVLKTALSGCDALLALIGPQWASCARTDGRRRLEVDDDWVRNEIAAALARNVVVMPVLLGDAKLPEDAELPENVRMLRKRQAAEITEKRWDYDVGELIKDLLKLTPLKPVDDDVASAGTGIRVLKDLVATVPAVADAVSRSKEVIENTYRQVGKLDLFKGIHDALHNIEFDCLRPVQAGGAGTRLRPFLIGFSTQARRIQDALQGAEVNPALRDDLVDGLQLAADAFRAAVDKPGEAGYANVLGELNTLLSSLPSRLDAGIADAAAELDLDRLVELMTTVRGRLAAMPSAASDSELAPFIQGVDALNRLRDELIRRVAEHTQLQRLDSKLRAVCVGEPVPGTVGSEWARIKLVRARIAAPFSPEIAAVNDDLAAIEGEIEATVVQGDEPAAFDRLREYFRSVGSVFRDVDGGLRDFCLRLSDVNQPLKVVLSLCR